MIPVTELTKTADIDCGHCTKCCHGNAIFLFPELGDKVELYDTVEAWNPFTNRMGVMLDHRPDGACGYLVNNDTGCGIHTMRPLLCRAYSCVEHYAKLPRAQKRQMKREGKWTGMWAEGERRFRLTVNGREVA